MVLFQICNPNLGALGYVELSPVTLASLKEPVKSRERLSVGLIKCADDPVAADPEAQSGSENGVSKTSSREAVAKARALPKVAQLKFVPDTPVPCATHFI